MTAYWVLSLFRRPSPVLAPQFIPRPYQAVQRVGVPIPAMLELCPHQHLRHDGLHLAYGRAPKYPLQACPLRLVELRPPSPGPLKFQEPVIYGVLIAVRDLPVAFPITPVSGVRGLPRTLPAPLSLLTFFGCGD